MKIPTKELNEMKERLSAEVIDDSEEIADWMAFHGVDLINEVLEYRKEFGREMAIISTITKRLGVSRYANLDWNIYTGNDDGDCDPSNGDECIVMLANGKFKRDKQYYGEWQNEGVVAWAFWDDDILNQEGE